MSQLPERSVMSERFFTVNLQVTRRSTDSFNDSFTLGDQEKWSVLRACASKVLKKKELLRFPQIAPDEPNLWFELYRYLPEEMYESQDEDLGSDQPNQIYLVLSEDDEPIDSFRDE